VTPGPRLVIVAAAALLGAGQAPAQPPLADDAAGMTCRHHVYGVHLEWLRRGGDWVDAAGKEYGDMAFAQAGRAGSDARQLQWDVTSLAQLWNSGTEPRGAIYLRSMSGGKSRAIDFHSRESGDALARPSLAIEWSDGTQSSVQPAADTYFSCSSYRSKGREPLLRIGPEYPALLVFPVEQRKAAKIRRALLTLTVRRPGNSAIGAFRALPPWARKSKLETGIAADYPRDRGIERHPDVVFASGFASSRWAADWSGIAQRSNIDIVDRKGVNGFEPLDGRALRVTIEKDGKLGLSMHYRFGEHGIKEPDEVYFRYYLRLGDNWGGRQGGKLPGIAGTYNRAGWGMRRSDGTNGWSARGSFSGPNGKDSSLSGLVGIGSYVYHADMEQRTGDHWGWNLGPSGLIEKNRWYSVEQYVKMNDPAKADGIFRAWIDGQLVSERTDVRYRRSPDLHVETVWMNVYHGGTSSTPHEMSLYIDNVVIANKYIGPIAE
jgi:hypothetical protein